MRYAGRVLDASKWVHLSIEADYAERYDGQVAVLTAANLLGRMTPSVALEVPEVEVVLPLPLRGESLKALLLSTMHQADPEGQFVSRPVRTGDFLVHLGKLGAPTVTHGSGWNAYVGPPPSPIPTEAQASNPIGPSFAAILTIAEAFKAALLAPPAHVAMQALTWSTGNAVDGRLPLLPDLGRLWVVGTGSVGTAILYFLTLATHHFEVTLFDMDVIKVENLDRSPIFFARDVGKPKPEVVAAYLKAMKVASVVSEPKSLDQSELWTSRLAGCPDVVVSAANERNVRAVIEQGFPPVQIYGTTGKNWQASVFRHIPGRDPCSCCMFPELAIRPSECATGTPPTQDDAETHTDAALPFLSFAAGAMAAAEILKLALPGYPQSENRVLLNTLPTPRLVRAGMRSRFDCLCRRRSESVHRQMIAGTRYERLSGW